MQAVREKSITAIVIEYLKNVIVTIRRIVRRSIFIMFCMELKEYFSNPRVIPFIVCR